MFKRKFQCIYVPFNGKYYVYVFIDIVKMFYCSLNVRIKCLMCTFDYSQNEKNALYIIYKYIFWIKDLMFCQAVKENVFIYLSSSLFLTQIIVLMIMLFPVVFYFFSLWHIPTNFILYNYENAIPGDKPLPRLYFLASGINCGYVWSVDLFLKYINSTTSVMY